MVALADGMRGWLVAGLSILASGCAVAETGMPTAPPCSLVAGTTYSIVRVVDGETLALDDGRMVRIVGALAPRAIDVGAEPGAWPPEETTRQALTTMAVGRTIKLWHDQTRQDRYGHQLAQAVVADGPLAGWLQGALVERGLARAYGRSGNEACLERLLALEKTARSNRLGLWALAAYAVRRPADGADLSRYVGTFQIVAATIHRVSRGRDGTFLGLESGRAADSRFGLAALIPHGRKQLLGEGDPRRLRGHRIEVRGWIENRRGPLILVDGPWQIELAADEPHQRRAR